MEPVLNAARAGLVFTALLAGIAVLSYLLLARLAPWLAELHAHDDPPPPAAAADFVTGASLDPRRRVN